MDGLDLPAKFLLPFRKTTAMTSPALNRRQLLSLAGAAGIATLASGRTTQAAEAATPAKPRFSLNTSTIRGQELTLEQEIDIAAKAGYDAIEPWMNKIQAHVQNGGKLSDIRKQLADHGLTVESAIGFAEWIVDDDQKRAQGLENAKRDMAMVAEIGGKRIAAPPVGATQGEAVDLMKAATRYRDLLEVGRKMEVVPQLELWGFSRNLSRLGEVALVAVEAGHPEACVLSDVYHVYKGGSDFHGLKQFSGASLQVFHMNDYPAMHPRETITDADRVFPGDGIGPLVPMLKDLFANGFQGTLSLELFNREYWQRDALEVATEGLEKLRKVTEEALAT